MKKILLFVAIIVLALLGWYWYSTENTTNNDQNTDQATSSREYALMLNDGSIGVLRYTNEERTEVFLRAYGDTYNLKELVAASGTRYGNNDESTVYWEHQGQATLETNDQEYIISRIMPADIIEMHIASKKEACGGVNNNQCLVVNGELFNERIEGFDYQEGSSYDIIVARTIRDNVQGDTPAYRYRLVEVLSEQAETSPEQASSSSQTKVLEGSSWQWQKTNYANGRSLSPEKSDAFVARFGQNGQFSSTTDCNSVSGKYQENGESLSFSSLATTLMACMGETQEATYLTDLGAVTSFDINEEQLLLTTENKAVMHFARTAN